MLFWSMSNFITKKPKRTLDTFLDLFRSSHRIVPFYNPEYLLVLIRAFRYFLGRGFSGHEAMQLGILNLDFPKTELFKYISKREMEKIQRSINPASFERVTENKGIFYMYCNALGIPVPKLYALFFHKTAGYSIKGTILNSSEDWQQFINMELPSEFIIKPTVGSYGADLFCFKKANGEDYIEIASGRQYIARDIYELMFSANKDFVVQERMFNHAELKRLSDTSSLQTLRMWTYVNSQGRSQILTAFFKPIVGQNITDNHEHGRSGNLCADIDLDKGTLKSAVKLIPDASGIMTVISHPKTGIPFDGFNIPLWNDVCRLARVASLKFMPIRIIGWDIAITPNGPYFIEANIYADPPNQHKKSYLILSSIRTDEKKISST